MKSYRLPLAVLLAVAAGIVGTVLVIDRHRETPPVKQVVVAAESPNPSPSPSPSALPPPPPEPSPEESEPAAAEGVPSCYKKVGADASRPVVRKTLVAAGRKQYWTTTK